MNEQEEMALRREAVLFFYTSSNGMHEDWIRRGVHESEGVTADALFDNDVLPLYELLKKAFWLGKNGG